MAANFSSPWRRHPGWTIGTRSSVKSWRGRMWQTRFQTCLAIRTIAHAPRWRCRRCVSSASRKPEAYPNAHARAVPAVDDRIHLHPAGWTYVVAGHRTAHFRGSAQHQLAAPQRGSDPVGISRALQAGSVVVALGELDARTFARASRNPDDGHFSRAVFVGGAARCNCWRTARG